jgi:hypothetical protein
LKSSFDPTTHQSREKRFLQRYAFEVLEMKELVVVISWGAIASLSVACFGPGRATASPSPNVVYGFAGLTAEDKNDEVHGLRATIVWAAAPRATSPYSVSTWIAFAAPSGGNSGGASGVSYRIVQIGLTEKTPNEYHVFWEWDNSSTDHHFRTGMQIALGTPIRVEIDHDAFGAFTLYANDVQQASVHMTWVPTAIGVFAETHDPADYLPGSQNSPEIISGMNQKVAGRWVPYQGGVLNTNAHYRTSDRADGSVLIWDERQ